MTTTPKLPPDVTSRNFSFLDMVMRQWGAEFNAPDHGTYEFSGGRRFDSTDMGSTGIYNPALGTNTGRPP